MEVVLTKMTTPVFLGDLSVASRDAVFHAVDQQMGALRRNETGDLHSLAPVEESSFSHGPHRTDHHTPLDSLQNHPPSKAVAPFHWQNSNTTSA